MFSRILNGAMFQSQSDKRARRYRDLIRREAKIGGELFGPIAPGGRREFFCLDKHTWIWHEEWMDDKGVRHAVTTRFDVRPHGVFKAQDGQPYVQLVGQEAQAFLNAVRLYNKRVQTEMYGAAA